MTYLPWLMSAITIYMTVLAGNKSRHAWGVGMFNQALRGCYNSLTLC